MTDNEIHAAGIAAVTGLLGVGRSAVQRRLADEMAHEIAAARRYVDDPIGHPCHWHAARGLANAMLVVHGASGAATDCLRRADLPDTLHRIYGRIAAIDPDYRVF